MLVEAASPRLCLLSESAYSLPTPTHAGTAKVKAKASSYKWWAGVKKATVRGTE